MLSGINEIAVILVIAAAIFILPAIKGRKSKIQTTSQIITAPWQMRLAIICFLSWICIALYIFKPWENGLIKFLGFGLGPLAAIAGIAWVIQGYRSRPRK